MFDESLNKELQKKQIDILIRTWHDNKISSRYYKHHNISARKVFFFDT
jgi:hypothetical protein